MKHFFLLFAAAFCTLVHARPLQPVNPVIGDMGYFMKYGKAPDASTGNHQRVEAHLSFAEFLLRNADVSGLSQEQLANRAHTLDLLHEYWTRGAFPRNDDYLNERRPCFIDHEGTICAVGYLIEQTAGRETAELISERHLYKAILEMNDPIIFEWIKTSGLTLGECAIIQPSYREYYQVSWYASYGVSYRITDNVYQSFQVYRKSTGSRRAKTRCYGARFDWLRNGNYSIGIRYGAFLFRGNYRLRNGCLALTPEMFVYNATVGMNLRPELEFQKDWKFFSAGLSYSYAIPIIRESAYLAGRHDLSLKLALNVTEIRKHIPRPEPKTPSPTPL